MHESEVTYPAGPPTRGAGPVMRMPPDVGAASDGTGTPEEEVEGDSEEGAGEGDDPG